MAWENLEFDILVDLLDYRFDYSGESFGWSVRQPTTKATPAQKAAQREWEKRNVDHRREYKRQWTAKKRHEARNGLATKR